MAVRPTIFSRFRFSLDWDNRGMPQNHVTPTLERRISAQRDYRKATACRTH